MVWAIFAAHPRQLSTSSASSGLVGVELDGAGETFLCLEFLLLAGIPNWTKLCFTQLQDSFKRCQMVAKLWEQRKKTSSLREHGFFGQINRVWNLYRWTWNLVRRITRCQSKKLCGFSVFRNFSAAMVSDVTRIGKNVSGRATIPHNFVLHKTRFNF